MIELANGLDRLLQLPIIVQPAANLGDPLPTYAQLTRTPTRISHRQHKHPMTFAARTLRTTTPMTDNALKQRAAHKLAADWKPIGPLKSMPNPSDLAVSNLPPDSERTSAPLNFAPGSRLGRQ